MPVVLSRCAGSLEIWAMGLCQWPLSSLPGMADTRCDVLLMDDGMRDILPLNSTLEMMEILQDFFRPQKLSFL